MRGIISNTEQKKKQGQEKLIFFGTTFFWFPTMHTGPFAERDLLSTCLRRQQEYLCGHV